MMYGACYDPNHSTAITRLTAEVARLKAIIENPTLLQWVPAHLLEAAQAEVARLEAEVFARAAAYTEAEAAKTEVARLTQERDELLAGIDTADAIHEDTTERIAARYDALRTCVTQLVEALREVERHCPCGARGESLRTHSHVTGCSVSAALAAAKEVLP